jgi:hypothetical protein
MVSANRKRCRQRHVLVDATSAFIVADGWEKGQAWRCPIGGENGDLLAILGFVIASFAVDKNLDAGDGKRANQDHVDVTTLMQNKLQNKPKYH